MFQLFIILIFLVWQNSQHAMEADPKNRNIEALSILDRRYNEVTFLASHNGSTNKDPNWKTLWTISVQNQNNSLEDQLKAGIRATKLPLHDTPEGIYACHGIDRSEAESYAPSCTPQCIIDIIVRNQCYVDPAAKPLEDVLGVIRKFLDKNPQEIFTLFLEGATKDHEKIAGCFAKAKLDPEHYVHTQDKEQPWPAIRHMLNANKRLVVFISSTNLGAPYHWLLSYNDFVWSTEYAFATVAALQENTEIRNYVRNYNARRGEPHNKIAVMQHFVTPSYGNISWSLPLLLAGDRQAAKEANKKEIILARYKALFEKSEVPMNFIWVDFSQERERELLDAIKEINEHINNNRAQENFSEISLDD